MYHLGCIAFEQEDFDRATDLFNALLEEAEGNLGAALAYAHEAQDLFTRLGVRREIDEIEAVIRRLEEGQRKPNDN